MAFYVIGFLIDNRPLSFFNEPESFFVWLGRHTHVDPRLVLWAATAVAVAGFLARFWGSAYLTAEIVWHANARDDRLIVDGPFRFMRDPLYFGTVLQAVGVGSLASPYGFAFIVLCNILFTGALVAHEAAIMQAKYGDAYERFRVAVPAMFPRLTPARVGTRARVKPSFTSGIRSELLSLGLAVGMVGIAIYGEAAAWFFSVCWIGGWTLQIALRYGARATAAT